MSEINSKLQATARNGKILEISDCCIITPDNKQIKFYSLPEIHDSKSAQYGDQPIQGRSSTVKTYSYSSNRKISLSIHLYVTREDDIENNMAVIRNISALVHPQYDNTYLPPPIARLKCGTLFNDDDNGIPVVLMNYSINYPTEVQWFRYEKIYMPLHVTIQTEWDVVYSWQNLPGYQDVLSGKY